MRIFSPFRRFKALALAVAAGYLPTNDEPTASNVDFYGAAGIGKTLTGIYDYSDADEDVESGSTYQWYRADDAIGTNAAAISGATNPTYVVQSADMDKYLRLGVTPSDGDLFGVEAFSSWKAAWTTNPLWGNVLALLRFQGAHASTTFTDEKGATWTSTVATITTAIKKWGVSCGDFVSDLSYIANNTIANFGTGQFTFAAWVYITSSAAPQRTLFRWGPSSQYAIRLTAASPRQLTYYNGSTDTNFGIGVPLNQWAFVTVVRRSGQLYAAVDGVMGSNAPSNSVDFNAANYSVGGDAFGQETLSYLGEFMLLNTGLVEWTTAYTRPATPQAAQYFGPGFPEAEDVAFTGIEEVSRLLTATYTYYNDSFTSAEDGTTYQWYRADNASGLNEVAISGATSLTYVLQEADLGKYVRIGITPREAAVDGNETFSAYSDEIVALNANSSTIWRLNITANNGNTNASLVELKFYDSVDAQISTAGGTAGASSSFSGSFLPANAFDNNTGTRWASGSGTMPGTVSIQMTFASAVVPHSFSVTGFGDGTSDIKDFAIQYWDGGTFVTVASYTNQTGWTGNEVRTFEMYP